MAIHIVFDGNDGHPIYASFAPDADPYVYGPPLVPAGYPYWFVTTDLLLARMQTYGDELIGWDLLADEELGAPYGYGGA